MLPAMALLGFLVYIAFAFNIILGIITLWFSVYITALQAVGPSQQQSSYRPYSRREFP